MMIQDGSQGAILVNLPGRLPEHKELQRLVRIVHGQDDCNVIVDFSGVDVVGCTTFTWLLELRQLLQDHGRKLVLCSVAPANKDVFSITRLDEVFDFVKDKFAALAHLQVLQ
jgi:anti-anti-sigma factor